ncbi:hypothetical protein ONA91_26400 [Micromonospora sp. DR5-3]|uniref:hypothetical protein n=1 Tax=unclassified Micromonospora TaxID=2617518 RepID=UPI0011D53F0A|nr:MULTISPECIES: hypothetical protein [unclassified Micromonospora]MCW3817986.1 hypothetical protein [Micromonospora sp. DR5-3]TYC19062.1 hypothetical protein FXF52_38675 [Micromonospora sp. MP36]
MVTPDLRGRRGPGVDVALCVAFAWVALSRAVHHCGYELAQAAAELRRLHHEVTDLLNQLDNAGYPAAAGRPDAMR